MKAAQKVDPNPRREYLAQRLLLIPSHYLTMLHKREIFPADNPNRVLIQMRKQFLSHWMRNCLGVIHKLILRMENKRKITASLSLWLRQVLIHITVVKTSSRNLLLETISEIIYEAIRFLHRETTCSTRKFHLMKSDHTHYLKSRMIQVQQFLIKISVEAVEQLTFMQ